MIDFCDSTLKNVYDKNQHTKKDFQNFSGPVTIKDMQKPPPPHHF